MSQEFSRVKVSTNKRSSFDLSHNQVTSTDFGKIIPICVRECIPNDDITLDPQVFIRLAPLAAPTFGHIKARVHSFFVPNRILWKNWDRWITGTYTSSLPYFTSRQLASYAYRDPAYINYNSSSVEPFFRGQICDLFTNLGLTQNFVSSSESSTYVTKLSAFPFLAYQRVWFDYFRDSNLNQDETWFDRFLNHDYGQYTAQQVDQFVQLRRACFKKDYFTTAKVNPQDGSSGASAGVSNDVSSGAVTGHRNVGITTTNSLAYYQDNVQYPFTQSISVNALRAATALQRYLERNNFVGARAISRLLAHFGIAPSAERLDMAEYLGGFDFPVQISDVTSTSLYGSSPSSAFDVGGLGTQAGKAIAAGNSNAIQYKAKEHGILISVLSIIPDSGYYRGLSRIWTRGYNGDGKFEFFTPEFENLGFQPILKRELYAGFDNESDALSVFGYSPRYSDYKFQNDVLAGDFTNRGTNTGTDSYHLFRRLESQDVVLNTYFTSVNNYQQRFYDRIFQFPGSSDSGTEGIDHFYCNVNCKCTMLRDMSSFTAPSIINSEEGDGERIDLPYGGIRL